MSRLIPHPKREAPEGACPEIVRSLYHAQKKARHNGGLFFPFLFKEDSMRRKIMIRTSLRFHPRRGPAVEAGRFVIGT